VAWSFSGEGLVIASEGHIYAEVVAHDFLGVTPLTPDDVYDAILVILKFFSDTGRYDADNRNCHQFANALVEALQLPALSADFVNQEAPAYGSTVALDDARMRTDLRRGRQAMRKTAESAAESAEANREVGRRTGRAPSPD